jgi:hypothetical protein
MIFRGSDVGWGPQLIIRRGSGWRCRVIFPDNGSGDTGHFQRVFWRIQVEGEADLRAQL